MDLHHSLYVDQYFYQYPHNQCRNITLNILVELNNRGFHCFITLTIIPHLLQGLLWVTKMFLFIYLMMRVLLNGHLISIVKQISIILFSRHCHSDISSGFFVHVSWFLPTCICPYSCCCQAGR